MYSPTVRTFPFGGSRSNKTQIKRKKSIGYCWFVGQSSYFFAKMSRRGSFATAIAHSGVMFGNSKGQNFLFDVTRARFIKNVSF